MGTGTMQGVMLSVLLLLLTFSSGAIRAEEQEVQDFEFADSENEIRLVKRQAPTIVETDDEDVLADEPGSGIDEYEGSGDPTNPTVTDYPTYYRVTIKIPSIEFYPDLGDRNTQQFRLLAVQLQREIEQLFRSIRGTQLVTIIEFSGSDRGYLLATFDLGSSDFSDDAALRRTLEGALRQGVIGSNRVTADDFSFRRLDGDIQCPSYVGRRPEFLPRNGTNWANLMINNAFPCAGRLVGWEYYRIIPRGDAFAGVWRQRSDSQFLLVRKSRLPGAEAGPQQVAVYPPINVQRGDFIGIFYPFETRNNVIAQATLEDDVVTPNELYQTFNAQIYDNSLPDGQVVDLNRISYTPRNTTFAIRALMDYTGADDGTIIYSCNEGEFSCGDGYCIPAEQQCDGELDCEFTGLDEKDCLACSADEFTCTENRECVPRASLCDGIADCLRGSDEDNCPTETATCNSEQFTCADGTCIDIELRCDAYPDCFDNSDEDPDLCLKIIPTVPPSCPEGYFRCDAGICLPGNRQCDGTSDCLDGTDEQNCESRLCSDDEFRCRDGTCIDERRRCDSILDCPDRSDEENCVRACSANEFTCANGRCIDIRRRCDDVVDCTQRGDRQEDRSDEEGCPCKANEFECASGDQCIALQLTCNREYDCRDGSDERNCPCREGEHTCGSGRCIPAVRVCDRRPDCEDSSDEQNCDRCRRGEFRCEDGSQCLPSRGRCDRAVQCVDGSDEANCTCTSQEFRCNNGQCISDRSRCDNFRNCFDGSDEQDCPRGCRSDQFTCGDGSCIDATRKCDGRPDCLDRSDEEDCPRRRRCPEDVFECETGHCLPMSRRCDGRSDCPNGSDEKDCPTCSPLEFTCERGGCIPMARRCDRRPDCQDRSDERGCPCGEGEFTCVSDGRCLPPGYRCNGNPDCRDGSDEQNCVEGCDEQREFTCDNDECVRRDERCDGKFDCSDGSDERGCARPVVVTVTPQQLRVRVGRDATFICQATGTPTPRVRWTRRTGGAMPSQATDVNGRLTITNVYPEDAGDYTCTGSNPSGSHDVVARLQVDYIGPPTEEPRPDGPCQRDEATCGDGQCIPRDYLCDGEADCSDGSDENNCNTPLPCEPNEFRCNNGRCALKIWRCDGDDDCFDRSDETDCPSRRPGEPCSPNEFMCRTGDQCVPFAYQCDGEIDCLDRSDEIGCTQPSIVQPPPSEISVDINGTFTIVCEAIGVPTPLITWRLNWGNIPSGERVTVTSVNGRGVLTVRQAVPEDAGAYTCEAINNRGSIFAVPDALIIVRRTVVCQPPNFNSDALGTDQCIRCFCFGRTQTCYSSNLQLSQITLGNRVELVRRNTLEPTEEGFVQYIPSSGEFEVREFNNVLRTGSYYWSLPYQYLSKRLSSYGGELSYQVYYEVDRFDNPTNDPDVIISGNGITLYHRSRNEFRPRAPTTVRVPLRESAWERSGDFGDGTSVSTYATREDLMMVLDNVTTILIRATYDNRQSLIRLGNVLLSTGVVQSTGLGRAVFVEECSCPTGYTGYSCEECAPGFYKVDDGPYGRGCISCNCNGHSNECDPISGICRNCRDNTAGPYCNLCAPGFYGDARVGGRLACQACPCPLTIPSNQFSPTCILDVDNEVTCDACPVGYVGRRCERCDDGYEGDPTQRGSRCIEKGGDEVCNPRGSLSNFPDRFTDQCECKSNVRGRLCDECQPSTFYLSEDYPHGCISCFCMGVTNTCQSTSWNRAQVGVTFVTSPAGVYITDMMRKQRVDSNFRVDDDARELSYRFFNTLERDTYYWALPQRFLGDKVASYGGYLRFTLRHIAGQDSSPTSLSTPLVEIAGNDIALVYRASRQIDNNRPQSFQVRFIETDWTRLDGEDATREHLMMALADLDFIIIRATFTDDTELSAISGLSMDIAEDRVTGQDRAEAVESCVCPRGYVGLSCEDCAPGYTRSGGGLYLGLCERCQCNGHATECDPETGVCRNCRHNTAGDKCEQCARGYYGVATRGTVNDCQKCPCPLTESPNQFSPDCILDTDNQVTCLSCPTGHVGRNCERCADGYQGNPMRPGDYCKLINVTCDCDPRGTIPNTLCDPDTQQCRCKNFAQGRRCSSCQEGYFNLASENEQGCLKCYCMGITNQCTSSNYYRQEIIPMLNADGSHNFALTNRRLSRRVTDGFSLDAERNEVTFSSFDGIQRERDSLYFLLPPKFRGNKVSAYGGYLRFGISYTGALDLGTYINDIDVEIISKQGKRLYYLFNPRPQSGRSYEYQIRLTEGSFRNPRDSAPPSREFFLTALANIEGIIIRAAYWSVMESVTLSDLRMEIAVPRSDGERLAPEVESCVCPEGYTGLSCEECAQGFVRAQSSGTALGVCIRCSCNGHATSCDPDTGECLECQHNTEGERCERCIRGYYGDPTDGNPDACRQCPCPLTIPSNQFSPTCFLDDDNQPTCDRCPAGYVGRNCGQCAPGYTGNPTQPGGRCQREDPLEIIVNPRSVTEPIGSTATFTCVPQGRGPFNVIWSRLDRRPLPRRAEQGPGPDYRLTISQLEAGDRGRYVCTVSNIYGSSREVVEINLETDPTPIRVRIEEPTTFEGTIGGTARFFCIAYQYSSPASVVLSWSKDGGVMPNKAVDTNGVLTIPNLDENDAGTYTCTGSDPSSIDTARAVIRFGEISKSPTVRIEPRYLQVTEGDSTEFRCIAEGEPKPTVRWTKGPDGPLPSYAITDDNGLFRINSISYSDQSEYYCTATNSEGTASTRTIIYVKRGTRPQVRIVVRQTNVTAVVGTSERLYCSVEGGDSSIDLGWSREGGLPVGTTQENGILYLNNIQPSFRGTYVCTGTSPTGIVGRATVEVNIVGERFEAPQVTAVESRVTIASGATETLRCQVSGNPRPTVTWSRGGRDLQLTSNHRVNGDTLRILEASMEDRGIYVCLAENRAGRAQAVIRVEVERREVPTIKLYPETQQVVRAGGNAVVYCMVSGIPTPSVTWTRANGRELTDRTSVEARSPEDLTLRFTDITSAEQGEYLCSATNDVGTVTATASVRVEGPPVIEITPGTRITSIVGERVNIECVGIGTPTPNVFWRSGQRRRSDVLPEAYDTGPGSASLLFDGISKTDAGRYICVATGEGGRTEEAVDVTVLDGDDRTTEQGVIIEGPREQSLISGQSVELTCSSSGIPNPRITWRRAGGLPMPPGHSVTNGVLFIPRIEPEYQGEYICTVSSRLVERDFSTSIIIIVRVTPQVTISPTRSQYRVGQRLTLRCSPGNPGYTVEWTKVDGALSPQAREQDGVLEIPQVSRTDAGRYRCIARGPDGSITEGFAIVEVSAPPQIVSITRLPELLVSGQSYSLECRVSGQQPIDIRWEKENGDLPVQHSIRDGVLTIFNIRPEDSGRYICTASNPVGTVRDYTYVTVRDSIVNPGDSGVRILNVGDTMELECLASTDGPSPSIPTVSWAKQGEPLPSYAELAGTGGHILIIRSIRLEDSGVYVCTVSNEVGVSRKTIRIVVEDRPSITGPEASYATAPFGSAVDLKCDVSGSPQPTVEWVKMGGDLPPNHQMLPEGTLRIPRVDEEDAGPYECRARNNRGTVVYPVYLVVGALVPYFEQNPTSYLEFEPLRDMYLDLDILLSFRPETTDGLMLYNGQYDTGSGDFVCFGLNRAVPEFRFDVGAGPAVIRGEQPLELDRWHTVRLQRNRKNGTMMVNDQPVVSGVAPGEFTALDLAQPFYVGNVPSFANVPRSVGFNRGFVGSISQIQVKGVDLNLGAEARDNVGVRPDPYVCSERPCQNDALCLPANTQFGFSCRCKPGFVGERCEIEGERCYEGACGPNGVCYNLPNQASFMCACPMGFGGEGCRQVPAIVDPAFNKTSFISYPTLSGLYNLRIRLTFKPRSLDDGIILYNAQMQDGDMDFIAVIIKNRYLEFRFDMGNGPAVLRSRQPLVVDRWTHVMVDRRRNEGILVVDNGDPVVDQVEPNDRLFLSRLERGDISRATSSGRSVGLNLQRPLFLGGVDPGETINLAVGVLDGFVGCIGEVVVGETQLNLIEDAILTANIQDCGDRSLCDRRPCQNDATCINVSPTEYVCQCQPQYTGRNCEILIDICVTESPCQNGGSCSVTESGEFRCACPIGWIGATCETEEAIGSSVEFFDGGYAELPRNAFIHRGPSRMEYMSLEIVTPEREGLIFWQGRKKDARTTKDFLALAVVEGNIEFSFELGSGVGRLRYPLVDVSDGVPHTINVTRAGRDATLSVDGGEPISGRSPGGLKMLNVPSNLYFGGLPDYQTFTDGTFTQGFTGCVRNVRLQRGEVVDFGKTALTGVNVRPCL